MTREEVVKVRAKGGGAARFAAGERYTLTLEAGKATDRWDSTEEGKPAQPITRAEFTALLSEFFEIVPPAETPRTKAAG